MRRGLDAVHSPRWLLWIASIQLAMGLSVNSRVTILANLFNLVADNLLQPIRPHSIFFSYQRRKLHDREAADRDSSGDEQKKVSAC
jgi:hypothetical protein